MAVNGEAFFGLESSRGDRFVRANRWGRYRLIIRCCGLSPLLSWRGYRWVGRIGYKVSGRFRYGEFWFFTSDFHLRFSRN
eukprot:IDg7858t1